MGACSITRWQCTQQVCRMNALGRWWGGGGGGEEGEEDKEGRIIEGNSPALLHTIRYQGGRERERSVTENKAMGELLKDCPQVYNNIWSSRELCTICRQSNSRSEMPCSTVPLRRCRVVPRLRRCRVVIVNTFWSRSLTVFTAGNSSTFFKPWRYRRYVDIKYWYSLISWWLNEAPWVFSTFFQIP